MRLDDGEAGPYAIVLGANAEEPNYLSLDTEVLVQNLIQGATYRAQYRALNQIGAGQWSDIAYLLVATEPTAPLKPVLLLIDETQIQIQITQSTTENGSFITAYHIYLNEGVNGTPFNEITAYDGLS